MIFILCDQQLKITFRKSSAPPLKKLTPPFLLTPPPKNSKSASPPFLLTWNIFKAPLQKGVAGHREIKTPEFLPQVPQEQETHYFTNRNTHTSAGQASIEQNVLVGNSSQVFYPFNSEEEEYELQNNLVQSETRLVHQRLLEDDFPIFVPANPQEQESNYVSMQNNHSSCQGGIVEENVTPEGDITVIFSNQN